MAEEHDYATELLAVKHMYVCMLTCAEGVDYTTFLYSAINSAFLKLPFALMLLLIVAIVLILNNNYHGIINSYLHGIINTR